MLGSPSVDPKAADPNATPDAPTWWGRRKQDIQGRQDQRFKDLGTVYQQFPGELEAAGGWEGFLGASDAQLGDVFEKKLGDRFIRREQDANGYDIFVTKGEDGQEQRGYLNKPGLDSEDVTRAIRGTLPYALVGGAIGAATRGAGIGIQAISQGVGAGTTSVAGDVAQIPLGSDQFVELGKAGAMTAFGAGAPVLGAAAGALWRRFVTIPGLIDRSTGQLTPKGMEVAKSAGIDTTNIEPDFAKAFSESLARSGNSAEAATEGSLSQFNIPATRGQITKDPYLLTQEEGMRRRLYGESAQDTMRGFDQRQSEAIERAAFGDDSSHFVGIGGRINPDRVIGGGQADRAPGVLGESVQDALQSARQGAKQQESKLWDDNVKNLAATPEALETLRPNITAALADETAFTPTGEAMAKVLGEFAEGKAPVNAAGGIELKPVQTVDQMRRRLGELVEAAPDADKYQAGKIYDAFNDWIGDAASKSLLAGDPAAAMQLVKARAFTKEVRQIFEPRAADGTRSGAGRRIIAALDGAKADSGESVIKNLIGTPGSRDVPSGAVHALRNVKIALDRFAPQHATQAWNDIRLAYWSRLVTGKNGDLLGPTAMASNLKSALHNQASVMQTLYTEPERRQITQMLKALETVSYKPPNASGSGYTAASFAKEGILRIIDSFGIGTPARAVLERTGIGNAWNSAAAKQAVRSTARPVRPNVAPYVLGGAQADQHRR
ncbi:hypothetical protein DLM45_02270 [Hyphomicrobium methylovorum]|nr:hypothetical protein [Hyphomicrobium methylovorum]